MLTPRRKAGFTLIELLVVISIITLLTALGAGAYFRIRTSQQEKLSGDRVSQLQKSMLQQWQAVLDTARKEPIPAVVMSYALNDPDRAKSIWAYLHLRANFPETVAEATSNVTLGGQVVLQANQKVASMVTGAGALPADEQAAVCAYAFLTAVNRRGMESGINDSMTGKVGTGTQFVVFTDTFNRPITFRRFFHTAEMDLKPFTANPAPAAPHDPLDPLGKLPALFAASSPLTAAQKADLLSAIGGSRTPDNSNFIPTFSSSGINRVFDPVVGGNPSGDDLYGYRLNVEGRTGN
ncbi:MAG: type II secretion system protein [Gemmataceae bacterium]